MLVFKRNITIGDAFIYFFLICLAREKKKKGNQKQKYGILNEKQQTAD